MNLQLNVLAELLLKIHPKYDDEWGPELPNVRRIGDLVFLNPQPLPPIAELRGRDGIKVHQVANAVINRMLVHIDGMQYGNPDERDRASGMMAKQVAMLADWCGTVPVSVRIAELLKKLGWKFPPPPEPDPHPDWSSMVMAAASFARAATLVDNAELALALNAGADRILAAGLKQGGF
jgi:hypothetical protein